MEQEQKCNCEYCEYLRLNRLDPDVSNINESVWKRSGVQTRVPNNMNNYQETTDTYQIGR